MKKSLAFSIRPVVVLVLIVLFSTRLTNATLDQKSSGVLDVSRESVSTLVVTSASDSGPGTLRQALLDAQNGDTITFDPVVFPPAAPVTIALTSGLPELNQGNLTIDASNAGVILDGSNIGATLETLLLDDISLTLDGGHNAIANGDFGAGLDHWRPWDGQPGATRDISTSDFHSSPNAFEWSITAQFGNSNTVYDTTDNSAPIDGWPFDSGSTVWVPAVANNMVEWRFWYRYGDISAGLHVLFPDGHEEAWWWYFDWRSDWKEALISINLPSDAVGVALEFEFNHPKRWTPGLYINSSHNTVRGLQIVNFPWDGVRVDNGAQYNTIGGDRGIGAGPIGQGNLINGNVGNGVYIGDPDSAYNTVKGNYIGLDATGAAPLGNRGHGVALWFATHHNQIIANSISGNQHNGVEALNDDVGNVIKDNLIGLDATGTFAIGNGDAGIFLSDSAWDHKAPRLTQILDNVIGGNGRHGISIQSGASMHNTVRGNYIGTDASGTSAVPNAWTGVEIQSGANHNLIGGITVDAANVIAYNNHYGVAVSGSDTLYNTISRNSIHDNDETGIELWGGGNNELEAPLIFDFDLVAGTVTGATCANCTVEIFSDIGEEGRVFEAQTKAEGTGSFVLSKGASLLGPHLTATATDADGNTSEFSSPTTGTVRSTILQAGNVLPKNRLRPIEAKQLKDNHIGHMLEGPSISTPQDADWAVHNINIMGLKWVRFSMDHFDSEVVTHTGNYSRHYVDPILDSVVTGLADNDITVMYSLVFWDDAVEVEEGYSRFKTEEEIQRYLDYAQFLVHHFKDRIDYYEILNEPESPYPAQHVEIPDYVNLVRRTVPIIRQEYPDARIVVGATTDLEYLFGILQSDVAPLVDAISWHVAGGESPGCKDEYWDDYPSLVQQIRDVASSHGFVGEYVAEELQWRTATNWSPVEPWHWIYSEPVAAKCYARGIILDLGMNLTTGLTLLELEGLHSPNRFIGRTVQNLSTTMAGTEPASLPVQIQSTATNTVSYTFSMPSGAHLVAVWTDGVAVDNDPGISATLTIPGLAGYTAIGIDVLHGFQQRLVTHKVDGNLLIRDLLVKDYPLILWLYEPKYVFLPVVMRATPGNQPLRWSFLPGLQLDMTKMKARPYLH